MSFSHAESTASNNPVLTGIVSDYNLDFFTWFQDFAAPDLVNNGELSGKIPIRDTESIRKELNTVHIPGQTAPQVNNGRQTFQSYDLVPHSLEEPWSDDEAARIRQGGMDPDAELEARMEGLKLKLEINEHVDLASLLTTSGNYDSTCVTAASTAWSSAAADPIDKVEENQRAIITLRGIKPNRGLCNYKTWSYLRRHAQILAALGAQKDKVATPEEVANLFGLDEIRITNAMAESAHPDQTASVDYILGAYFVQFYMPPSLAQSAIGPNFQFARTIRNAAKSYQVIEEASERLDPGIGKRGHIYTLKAGYYQAKMVSVISSSLVDSTCGGLITGCY
jgi:hypothetical protein